MVTSGYETKFQGGDSLCVLFNTFIQFFSLLSLDTNIPDASLNTIKGLLTSSSLFTHPIIPRLLQDQEIMSLRPYVLS